MGWGLADQAVSSSSNFAVTLVIARSSTPEDLGAFGVSYLGYLLVLGLGRAMIGEVVLIRLTGSRELRGISGRILGLYGLVGILGTVPLALVASLFIDIYLVLALGIFIPILLIEDGVRYVLIALGNPRRAFYVDLLWLIVFLALTGAVHPSDPMAARYLVLFWGASGGIATLLGVVLLGSAPRKPSLSSWIKKHWGVIGGLLGEFAATVGAAQTAGMLIPAVIGLAAFGGLQLAQVALGPLTVVFLGVVTIGVAELRRTGKGASPRGAAVISSGLVGMTLVVALLLLSSPHLLQRVFGRGWVAVEPVVGLVLLRNLIAAAGFGPIAVLRATERVGLTARSRSAGAFSAVACSLLGGWIAEARGAAAGLAVGALVSTALLWVSVRESAARSSTGRSGEFGPFSPPTSKGSH